MKKEDKIKILTEFFDGDVEKAKEKYKKIENALKKHEKEKCEAIKENTRFIKKIIKKMIPKKELKDGVVYEVEPEFARSVTNDRARWDEKKGTFIYKRYKFGCEIEDYMDYFGDVAFTNIAGCAPIKVAEKQVL